MSKINYPKLFDAVFHAYHQEIDLGRAPTIMIQAQKNLIRITKASYVKGAGNKPSYSKAKSCLVVRDGRPESDLNRFTGSSPDNAVSQGGVYLSMNSTPLILETTHYNGTFEAALRKGSVILNCLVQKPIMVADLSSHGNVAKSFVNGLGRRSAIQAEIAAAGLSNSLWDLLFSKTDYSVSRAFGLAAGYFPYLDGVAFKSARTIDPITTGDNVVLFGKNGSFVSSKLKVESCLRYQGGRGRNENPFVVFEF